MSLFVIATLLITATSAQYEGDDCVVQETGENGKCVSLENCKYAKQLINLDQIPQFCGLNYQLPLACCPSTETIASPGTRSIERCKEYQDPRNQIYGIFLGEEVQPREFKHMVALGYGNTSEVMFLCGGTLISDQFVLTAAHCLRSKEFGPPKMVRLADLDLKSTTDDAFPQDIAITESFINPDYKPPSYYNDIALLKLEKKVWPGVFIRPACLHTEHNLPLSKFQISGWGIMNFYGETSSHLLKADVDIVEHNVCASKYSHESLLRLPRGIVEELLICAGDAEGTNTCPGDSGGPLHFRINETMERMGYFVVVGVTSFGIDCGPLNSAGVYARVSAYIDWIENIVWP